MAHDRASQSKRRRFYLALVLLLPIVLMGARFLALWHPSSRVVGFAVSQDGTRLAVLSEIEMTDRYKVMIWDRDLKRVNSLLVDRPKDLCLSTSGDKFAVVTRRKDPRGNVLDLFDVASGERRRFVLQEPFDSINFLSFASDDQSMLVGSNNNLAAVPIGANAKTIFHNDLPIHNFVSISRDRTKLCTVVNSKRPGYFASEIFDVSQKGRSTGTFEPQLRIDLEQPGEPEIVLNTGAVIATYRSQVRGWIGWTDGKEARELPADFKGHSFALSLDERRLIHIDPNLVREVELESMRVTRRIATDLAFTYVALLTDDLVVGTLMDPNDRGFGLIYALNLSTDETKSAPLQLVDRDLIWFVAPTVLVFISLWVFCWVRAGLTSRWRFRAGVDIAILHILFGGTLIYRIVWSGVPSEWTFKEGGALFGWLVTLLCLVVFLQTMGGKRPVRHVPWFLFGVAAIWWVVARYVVVSKSQLDHVVVAATVIGLHFLCFGIARVLGLRLCRTGLREPTEPSRTRTQFTTRNVILLTAAIATLAYVYQTIRPSAIDINVVGYLVLYGLGVTAIEFSCLWLALGRRWIWARMALCVICIPCLASTASVAKSSLFIDYYSDPITWFLLTWTVAALLAVSSLLILRAHGYRLRYSKM